MFKKKFLLLLIGVFGSAIAQADLPNLYEVKQELIRYHDSGQYFHEITEVDQNAAAYLLERVEQNTELPADQRKKLAIVLDIDETSLSNYPDMVAFDFGGTEKEQDDAIALGHDPAIAPTLALYRLALKHHIAVFFVTGRQESLRAATESNLKKAGFISWSGLMLKPDDYIETSVVPYKTDARAKIEAQGYDIIFTMGDQESDLKGTMKGRFADKTFKIPDPYYFIP